MHAMPPAGGSDHDHPDDERLERLAFDQEMHAAGFVRDPKTGAWVDRATQHGR